MIFENIANILAMIFSLIAIVMLTQKAIKIGGNLGTMLKWVVAGIFLSVFVHSTFELISAFNLLGSETLLWIMGILLTLGSACFIIGAYLGKSEF